MPFSIFMPTTVPVSRRSPLSWPFRSMTSYIIHSGLRGIPPWSIPRIPSWTIVRTPRFQSLPFIIVSIPRTRLHGSPNQCVIVVMILLRMITRWYILSNSPQIWHGTWFFELWLIGMNRVMIRRFDEMGLVGHHMRMSLLLRDRAWCCWWGQREGLWEWIRQTLLLHTRIRYYWFYVTYAISPHC
jgi:hypothetical protein